jgi:hypothetical protein
MPYISTIKLTTPKATASGVRAYPLRLKAPRSNQKAAKASWIKPPIRRTRCDQASVAASHRPATLLEPSTGTVWLVAWEDGFKATSGGH